MYHVTSWKTREVLRSFELLNSAKRYCRELGYTENNNPMFVNHSPIAYVQNSDGECVYNPRFKKYGEK